VPASPLAQPRAVLGGNLISAVVGVSCALALHPWPLLAVACAVALAIAAMALLGCLHPPGGAVALGAALAVGPAGSAAYGALIVPVGLCSLLLVLCAMAYAKAIGRTYPHRAPAAASPHATRDAPPLQRVGFNSQDIDKALEQYGELLDVEPEDLDALFREVELQAHRRIHAHIRCGEIMSRDVLSVELAQSSASAFAYLQRHDLRSAPVVDEQRRVVGLVRRAELQAGADRPVSAVLDPFVHRCARTPPSRRCCRSCPAARRTRRWWSTRTAS
jgi:CBS domain-containing membrane protein